MAGCRALTKEEVSAVYAAFSGQEAERNRALFLTGIYTGLRVSDICNLRVSNFLNNGVWLKELTIKEIKTGKTRTIAIGRAFAEHIHRFIINRIENEFTMLDDYVFVANMGEQIKPKSLIPVIKSAVLAAGLPAAPRTIGTHCMRKTYAAFMLDDLLADGVAVQEALQVLCAAMGHSDISSTIKYIGWDQSQVQTYNKRHGERNLV